ncbi:MAG: hypothetical protein U1F41_01255 [Burkholderiales bacterium]
MSAVNWDQPSTGLVSDPNPSLELANDKGGALRAKSEGVTIEARSIAAEALVARTRKTVTARITSDESIAAFCNAPKATALLGGNEAETVAVAGVNLPDPKKPVDSMGGIGVAGLSTRFAAVGVMGATFGPRSTGVWGDARGGGVGVRGTGPNAGVVGQSVSGDGVQGYSQWDGGSGVYGYAPGVQGAGVSGRSAGGAGVDGGSQAGPGVRGASAQANGVEGLAQGGNAAGVSGRNDSGSGVGVEGFSNAGVAVRATSSSGTALHAESFSGVGIDVTNTSTSQPAVKSFSPFTTAVQAESMTTGVKAIGAIGTGVFGGTIAGPKAGSPEVGCGVFGSSFLGAGVCGITVSGTGVLGIGAPVAGGWAGRFQGDVRVDGILWKSASLFSIDHPLDPRKVLNHACVESPEYKTFYDGIAVLDARGNATVKLPRWFDALNHELRYQLTAIGAAAPGLHVAREYAKGSFAIGGGAPRQKVCWQVTAVRRDRWAKAHPLVVEQSRRDARADAPVVTRADAQRVAAGVDRAAKYIQRRARAAGKVARASAQRVKIETRAAPAGESPVAAAQAILRAAKRGSSR